ncbi:MAG: acetyl/propionyl/methylcrotonyl-CoA carboxylase subunit alpha [Burkholderiaceae bacterium]|nr:acetyl/propionyl/methylcrotonyl-CoA carboxylase subunit alpha [Burkholderiaceae bacterium]
MFDKILIANRGEIACRVATTARRLGIRTVAVHSDADAGARHVAACDEAWRIGPAPARESYLRGEEILRVARESGAQAIHPGYGFLSENESFAQACADAGIVFIGPPAAAIRAMGLKAESKRLMAAAGVPLVPGYHDAEQDPSRLRDEADRIGYPVLIKASAGGGGKGMRVVATAGEFDSMLASCRREAAAAFGNDAVLIERYLQRPRHVEIQVFADTQGHCLHLFERDCSVQRRHQKVVEEAPAPGMSPTRREAMGAAAVAAARAVGYVGAGTVEFIVDSSGDFYFMEMNTRLQVEHPVTEMITGLDLVEWQLRVASGEPLPVTQAELAFEGHAIEARIYAENPEKGFLPSVGTLLHFATPPAVEFRVGEAAGRRARLRIDAGVGEGDAITPFYDPMIAKVIAWGEDRDTARRGMDQALAGLRIVGPASNVGFLRRLMADTAFAQADLDTGLIERRREHLLPPPAPATPAELGLAAAAVLRREPAGRDPWDARNGWRLAAPLTRRIVFAEASEEREVLVTYRRAPFGTAADAPAECRFTVAGSATDAPTVDGIVLAPEEDGTLVVQVGERRHRGHAVVVDETLHLFTADRNLRLRHVDRLLHAGDAAEEGGRLTAPMPGKVISVLVQAGQRVTKGQALLVMEAMKMEHTIAAPLSGEVTLLHFGVGDQVPEGEVLVAIESPAAPEAASPSR